MIFFISSMVYGTNFEMIFEFFAHEEGSSIVKLQHKIKGAVGIVNFAIITLSVGMFFQTLLSPAIADSAVAVLNCFLAATWIAFVLVYFYARIRLKLFYYLLSFLTFSIAFIYLYFISPVSAN